MRVEKYDGSMISYQGVAFKGSPVDVFWNGFIEPYLENYSMKALEQTSALSLECQFSLDETIEEAKCLLLVMIRRVYAEMADTDRVLRGDGINFPEKRDVSGRIDSMSRIVNAHAEVEKNKKPLTGNKIFNIENINGNNLQFGNNNNISISSLETFFQNIISSGDKEAILALTLLLNNKTVSSLIDTEATKLAILNSL
jgi:hypothetical protein